MKTICILNNKGGVGKTASVTTIGHCMATIYGKRVLMVDLDPQANTSIMYNKDMDFISIFRAIRANKSIESSSEETIEDVLMHSDLDIHNAIKKTNYENLDILPSRLTLSMVEDLIKADVAMPQQFKLKQQLSKVQDEYDYCLIDCSPSVSIININGLVASDEVYIPLRCDGNSLVGAGIALNLIDKVQSYNPALKIAGVFLTQYDSRESVSGISYDVLSGELGEMVLPIQIGTTKYLKENTFMQEPLLALDSGKNKCSVSLAYMKLTEYMMAPNKKVFLKEYTTEIEKIKQLRLEEEKSNK